MESNFYTRVFDPTAPVQWTETNANPTQEKARQAELELVSSKRNIFQSLCVKEDGHLRVVYFPRMIFEQFKGFLGLFNGTRSDVVELRIMKLLEDAVKVNSLDVNTVKKIAVSQGITLADTSSEEKDFNLREFLAVLSKEGQPAPNDISARINKFYVIREESFRTHWLGKLWNKAFDQGINELDKTLAEKAFKVGIQEFGVDSQQLLDLAKEHGDDEAATFAFSKKQPEKSISEEIRRVKFANEQALKDLEEAQKRNPPPDQ